MEDLFYIICTNKEKDWWQLRTKRGHIVVACTGGTDKVSGKDNILRCLRQIVQTYRGEFKFNVALHSMEKVPRTKEQLQVLEKEYEEVGSLYEEDVVNAVLLVQKEHRKLVLETKSPVSRVKKVKVKAKNNRPAPLVKKVKAKNTSSTPKPLKAHSHKIVVVPRRKK